MKYLVFVFFLFSISSTLTAATIRGINKSANKIILKLSRKELAEADPGDHCLLIIIKEQKTILGKIVSMDPVKSTALIKLEDPDESLVKKSEIRFLPIYWNFLHSPSLASAPQYHQYPTTNVELDLNYKYRSLEQVEKTSYDLETVESSESTTNIIGSGTTNSFIINTNIVKDDLGFKLKVNSIKEDIISDTDGTKTEYNSVVTVFQPEIWYRVEENWRLGIGLIHHILDRSILFEDTSSNFASEADQAILSVLNSGKDSQYGFWATNRVVREIPSNIRTYSTSSSTSTTYVENYSSQMEIFYRSVNTPESIWGLKLGFTFWERDRGNGEMAPEFSFYELMRVAFVRENRLSSGDKIETIYSFKGSKTPTDVNLDQGINTVGLDIIYRTHWSESLSWGLEFSIDGGLDSFSTSDDLENDEIRNTDTSVSGFQSYIGLLISNEF
jgi:hypothetical protein